MRCPGSEEAGTTLPKRRQARRGEARFVGWVYLFFFFYLLLVFLFELLQLYRSHCICHKIFHLFLIVFFQARQILRELNRSRVRREGGYY